LAVQAAIIPFGACHDLAMETDRHPQARTNNVVVRFSSGHSPPPRISGDCLARSHNGLQVGSLAARGLYIMSGTNHDSLAMSDAYLSSGADALAAVSGITTS